MEAIYEHLDEVNSARFRNALEQGRDDAFLSKHLVTIVGDVPVSLDLEACRVGEIDRERVVELFRELEFRALLDRLPGSGDPVVDVQVRRRDQLSFFAEEAAAPAARGSRNGRLPDRGQRRGAGGDGRRAERRPRPWSWTSNRPASTPWPPSWSASP